MSAEVWTTGSDLRPGDTILKVTNTYGFAITRELVNLSKGVGPLTVSGAALHAPGDDYNRIPALDARGRPVDVNIQPEDTLLVLRP